MTMTGVDWIPSVPDSDLIHLFTSVNHHGNGWILQRLIAEFWRRFSVPIEEWPVEESPYALRLYRTCRYSSSLRDPAHRPARLLQHDELRGLECSCGYRSDSTQFCEYRVYRV